MVRTKTAIPKHAVIFDFDGTIADSFDYVFEFLRAEAKNPNTFNVAEQTLMRKMSMKRLALHLGVPPIKLISVYFKGRRAMRAHMEDVRPFPGMELTIRTLHAQGCLLFVVSSNSSRNVRLLLRHHGLLPYFTAVRGGAGIMGKARLIRQLLLRYRLPRKTTWYVGDETGDIVASTAAGIPCLAVTWGFADPYKLKALEPAELAEYPTEIPEMLEAAWKK